MTNTTHQAIKGLYECTIEPAICEDIEYKTRQEIIEVIEYLEDSLEILKKSVEGSEYDYLITDEED